MGILAVLGEAILMARLTEKNSLFHLLTFFLFIKLIYHQKQFKMISKMNYLSTHIIISNRSYLIVAYCIYHRITTCM